MTKFDTEYPTRERIVRILKAAAETGHYTGTLTSGPARAYFERCQYGWAISPDYGVKLIFTRDIGHHTSGWFKNPDYERCYHLSISYWMPGMPGSRALLSGAPRSQDHAASREWCKLFFGHDHRLLWVEPPYSPEGRRVDCYHYRLFCDEGWQAIKPRGEVYSKEFTEHGWKSFSEIHGDNVAELRTPSVP